MTSRLRLAEALLRLASRRWPAEIRVEQGVEWHAELAAISDGTAVSRWYRRLRFAASLAVARPVEPGPGAHRITWRETWFGAPGLLGRFTVLLVAPLAGLIVLAPLRLVATNLAALLRTGGGTILVEAVVSLVVTAVGLFAVMAAGWSLARGAMRSQISERGRVLEVGAAQILLGAGVVLATVLGDQRAGLLAIGARPRAVLVGGSVAIATVLSLALVAALVRRRAAGRSTVVIGVMGWLLTVDLAVAAACLPVVVADHASPAIALAWLPVILVVSSPPGPPVQLDGTYVSGDLLGSLPLLLLVATAFGLAYAVRMGWIRSGVAAEPATAAIPDPTVAAASTGTVVVAGVAAVVGMFTWLVALTVLTPWQERRIVDAGHRGTWTEELSEYRAWLLDLRLAAIVLVALAVTVLVARSRPSAAHGLVPFCVLLLVDRVVAARMVGTSAAGLTGALGFAVVVALWVFLRRPAAGASVLRQRRLVAGVAIVGGYVAPTLNVRGGWGPPAVQTMPPGLGLLTTAVAVMMMGLAAACAFSARPVRRGQRVVLGAALIAGIGMGVVAALADHLVPFGPLVLVLLAPWWMVAVVRYRRSVRSTVLWLTAGFGGALAAVPMLFLAFYLPLYVLTGPLNPPTGDGFAVGIGATAIALVLAAVLAPVAVPRPKGTPASAETLHLAPAE